MPLNQFYKQIKKFKIVCKNKIYLLYVDTIGLFNFFFKHCKIKNIIGIIGF